MKQYLKPGERWQASLTHLSDVVCQLFAEIITPFHVFLLLNCRTADHFHYLWQSTIFSRFSHGAVLQHTYVASHIQSRPSRHTLERWLKFILSSKKQPHTFCIRQVSTSDLADVQPLSSCQVLNGTHGSLLFVFRVLRSSIHTALLCRNQYQLPLIWPLFSCISQMLQVTFFFFSPKGFQYLKKRNQRIPRILWRTSMHHVPKVCGLF